MTTMKKSVVYFEKSGLGNTEETVKLAYQRALELGIKDIVVASSHGGTALAVSATFHASKFNIIAVTVCEGYKSEGWAMTKREKAKLLDKGIKVFTGIHALGDD